MNKFKTIIGIDPDKRGAIAIIQNKKIIDIVPLLEYRPNGLQTVQYHLKNMRKTLDRTLTPFNTKTTLIGLEETLNLPNRSSKGISTQNRIWQSIYQSISDLGFENIETVNPNAWISQMGLKQRSKIKINSNMSLTEKRLAQEHNRGLKTNIKKDRLNMLFLRHPYLKNSKVNALWADSGLIADYLMNNYF